jgi:hypothetical protein
LILLSSVREKGRNVLYRNLGGGRFEDVTESAGVGDDGWGCGVCVGDYDNDGNLDLYVTNFGPNVLYRSRGDGTFEATTESAGVADAGWGAGASFFDADGDGDLDLYVANYIDATTDEVLAARRTNKWREKASVMAGPFGLRGGRDVFYRNNGDGSFTDDTEQAGMTDLGEAYGLGVLASDLDADGDVDVYVANDSNANYLFRNKGDGAFDEIGSWSGAGFSSDGNAQAGMGVDAGDIDGDGLEDIIVTNFARDYCTLYSNLGGLFFEDATMRHELRQATFEALSWGCAFFDADRDADLDLVIINGHIYPQVDDYEDFNESYRQFPSVLRNEGGRLRNAQEGDEPVLPFQVSGRGLAVGDVDNDGDLDLLITAMDAPPLLLRNDTPSDAHWLKLRLLNEKGAHDLNAVATITTGDTRQKREVRSGSTYQSQSALDLHFGLGDADTIDTLEVRWSDGTTTVEHDLAVDQLVTLRRPENQP